MIKRAKPIIDPEIVEFEEALLRSLDQSTRGEGRVNAAQEIAARRGRPVGSVKADPKVPTTIRFDRDVLDALKASGRGWQTRVNDAVRDWLARQSKTDS
ncbi:BrnA antitoxin family protein [Oxalobacteraceae bacterium]|nr:BrnA antitoxin family protein [Oxalobacteraceae bacterium]